MVVGALVGAGLDPSYVIGGAFTGTKSGGHLGTGDVMVVEADESDGSFLQYPAQVAVVTNVDPDHLSNWGTAQAYADGFERFATADARRRARGQRRRPGRGRADRRRPPPGPRRDRAGPRDRHLRPGRGRRRPDQRGDVRGDGLELPARPATASAGRSRSTCPAPTTSPTPPPRTRSSPGSASTTRRRASSCRPTRAPTGASSSSGRSTASACSTTTPTTRPRWPTRCGPRARPCRVAGGGRVVARAAAAPLHPDPRPLARARRGRRRSPTRRWSWTSAATARTRSPA